MNVYKLARNENCDPTFNVRMPRKRGDINEALDVSLYNPARLWAQSIRFALKDRKRATTHSDAINEVGWKERKRIERKLEHELEYEYEYEYEQRIQ